MSARTEYLRQLARKCAAAADAAADPVTKAKFEQEQHQWLLRAEQAEKTERIQKPLNGSGVAAPKGLIHSAIQRRVRQPACRTGHCGGRRAAGRASPRSACQPLVHENAIPASLARPALSTMQMCGASHHLG